MKPQNTVHLIIFITAFCASTFCLQACADSRGLMNESQANAAPAPTTQTTATPTETPQTIYGITTDTIPDPDKEDEFKKLTDPLKVINEVVRPTIRIIIDPNEKVDPKLPFADIEAYKKAIKDDLYFYETAINRIKPYSKVMVCLADSSAMHFYRNKEAFRQKAQVYVERLGGIVDIWEVGNEINGEWVGWRGEDDIGFEEWRTKSETELKDKRQLVYEQVKAAYEEVKKKGGETALTLYYNGGESGAHCWAKPEYAMRRWVNDHIKDEDTDMRSRLNNVLISFYYDDCKIVSSDLGEATKTWVEVFFELSGDFGKANLGFGEFGPQCYYDKCKYKDKKKKNRRCSECIADQLKFIPLYYKDYHTGIKGKVPRYVGGYFYWYFWQDMVVSEDKSALRKLKEVIKSD